ncbi:serine hydrolase domain-containing protein [Kribbella sp. NPDC056951]|uniref:serine hydrolase domain-containing protein n=1 Tax=Kribbella sp. NPDC056951 TaxID=3345978 RepID=UPI00363962BF
MRRRLFAAIALTLVATAVPVSAEAGRSTLQRDADGIVATGVTGVLARETSPHGSRTAVSGVQVRPDGRFRIGSTNKVLVGTVVLQLVAEGRMRLDDSVEKWLPGRTAGTEYNGRKITVRQLLQHTAGISDESFPNIESAQQYYERRYLVHTEEAIVQAGLKNQPTFPPGKGWSYSNTGYDLVGLVIQAVTGRTWYDEVDRRIVRPLHLRDTYFPRTDPRIAGPHARGYTRFTAGEYTDTTDVIDADASGGYISTLKDLDRILRSIFDGRLLAPAQLDELTTTVETDETAELVWRNPRYGLGVFSRDLPCGGRVWIPGGDQIGFKTRAAVSADGRRSVVVSMSTQLYDSMDALLAQEKAASKLIDEVMCR